MSPERFLADYSGHEQRSIEVCASKLTEGAQRKPDNPAFSHMLGKVSCAAINKGLLHGFRRSQGLFGDSGRAARNHFSRRAFLGGLTLGAAAWSVPGAFANDLTLTAPQTEGPFYPDRLPLDTDNDLIVVNDQLTPAVGEITHLTGQVLSSSGAPLRNVTVEIWQVDNNGIYIHSRSPGQDQRDTNFQGYGRFLTGANGEYYFRTIKPIPYGGESFQRTPHIHVAINRGDQRLLTTQLYVRGHELNQRDGVLRGIRDPQARESVLVDFVPVEGSRAGELQARFDVVLGHTPAD